MYKKKAFHCAHNFVETLKHCELQALHTHLAKNHTSIKQIMTY